MTENGPIPDINQSLSGGAPWSFFMSWNDVWVGNSDQHLRDVYSNSKVITLENVNYNNSCAASPITPYIRVNNVWTQTGAVTVAAGTQVVLGPQPSSGGSWSWSGCGTSGTSREQTIYPTAGCDIVATYTNSCGARSTYTFQIRITGSNPGTGIVSGQTYSLRARHSGKALDVNGASTEDGADVHQWTNYNTSNQHWILTDVGSGYYRVSPSHSTGKALDVNGGSSADGANVQIWAYGGGYNQQWQFVDKGNGYYQIKDRNSGKCLDIAGASTADGANAQLWTCSEGYNQQFQVTRVSNARLASDVEKEKDKNKIDFYPNPSTGTFKVNGIENGKVKIFNLNGEQVFEKVIKGLTEINTGLGAGYYILQIEEKRMNKTSQLIIR